MEFLSTSLFTASLFASGSARADVVWSAPSDCPSESEVNARAKGAIAGAEAPNARVDVRRDGPRFRADLVFESGAARSFDGETCAVIADAVVLVLSLSATHAEEPPRDRAVPKAPEPTTPPRGERLRGLLGLAPLADFGTLPSLAPGILLTSGFVYPHARLELRMFALAPNGKGAQEGVRGEFGAIGGGVRAGWLFGTAVRVGPMAGLSVERWTGETSGAGVDGDAAGVVLAPEVAAVVDLRIVDSFHIVGSLEGRVPLNPPPFVVTGIGEVHRANSVLARAVFGAELRF